MILGLSATALFIYLHISPLVPLPVVITGVVTLVRDARDRA